jgi:hypothetical protein
VLASAPKTPLELPPEGFIRPTPPEGYVEDIVDIPSRASKDRIPWRLLTPVR